VSDAAAVCKEFYRGRKGGRVKERRVSKPCNAEGRMNNRIAKEGGIEKIWYKAVRQ
jgi:hypothetical protein